MTDTGYREFSYINEVVVRITSIDFPDNEPGEILEILVHDPAIERGEAWSDASYLEALEPVTWEEGAEGPRPYVLDVSKSHFSWGADGAGATIVLAIANLAVEGVVSAASWAAVVSAFKKISQMGRHVDSRSLEREEAIGHAQWRVQAAYKSVNEGDLTLVGEAHDVENGTWTIDFKTPEGVQFRVVLGVIEGLPYTSRISRRQRLTNPYDGRGGD